MRIVAFNFESELNRLVNRINRRQQTRKVNTGRSIGESIIHISKKMKQFICIENFFYKKICINVTKQGEKVEFPFPGPQFGNAVKNRGCMPNTQMGKIQNFLDFNRRIM